MNFDEANIREKYRPFLKRAFATYFSADRIMENLKPIPEDPAKTDWATYEKDTTEANNGKFTVNPEMLKFSDTDLENAVTKGEIAILYPSITRTYAKDYYFPGIELGVWFTQHPHAAVPAEMKVSDSRFYLPGSLISGNGGRWRTSVVLYDGSGFKYGEAVAFNFKWNRGCRVLLLKR
jgi:hypothetical protein